MTDDVFKDILRIQNQLAAQYESLLSESLIHTLGQYDAMTKILQESLAPLQKHMREVQEHFAYVGKELVLSVHLGIQEAIRAQNFLIEAFTKLDMSQVAAVVPSEITTSVSDMSLDVINQIDVRLIDDKYIAESQSQVKKTLIQGELLTWGNIIAVIGILLGILIALATSHPTIVNETYINQLIVIESITLEGLENLNE